jgi:hypothetical protein
VQGDDLNLLIGAYYRIDRIGNMPVGQICLFAGCHLCDFASGRVQRATINTYEQSNSVPIIANANAYPMHIGAA